MRPLSSAIARKSAWGLSEPRSRVSPPVRRQAVDVGDLRDRDELEHRVADRVVGRHVEDAVLRARRDGSRATTAPTRACPRNHRPTGSRPSADIRAAGSLLLAENSSVPTSAAIVKRAAEQRIVGEPDHPGGRLALALAADRRLGQLRHARHQIDARIGIVRRPADALRFTPDAPVHDLADHERAVFEVPSGKTRRDTWALRQAALSPLRGHGRRERDRQYRPTADDAGVSSGSPRAIVARFGCARAHLLPAVTAAVRESRRPSRRAFPRAAGAPRRQQNLAGF